MAKVTRSNDCGNAPKNKMVESCAIDFLTGNVKSLLPKLSDDIVWEPMGRKLVQGKDSLAKRMRAKNFPATATATATATLQIDRVGSHGYTAFANGELSLRTGKHFGFCLVAVFANTKGDKVSKLTTYMVPIDK